MWETLRVGKEFCRRTRLGCLPGSHQVVVNSRQICVYLLVPPPVCLCASSLSCMLCSSLNYKLGVRTGPPVKAVVRMKGDQLFKVVCTEPGAEPGTELPIMVIGIITQVFTTSLP